MRSDTCALTEAAKRRGENREETQDLEKCIPNDPDLIACADDCVAPSERAHHSRRRMREGHSVK